jgi:hypothetical protein
MPDGSLACDRVAIIDERADQVLSKGGILCDDNVITIDL